MFHNPTVINGHRLEVLLVRNGISAGIANRCGVTFPQSTSTGRERHQRRFRLPKNDLIRLGKVSQSDVPSGGLRKTWQHNSGRVRTPQPASRSLRRTSQGSDIDVSSTAGPEKPANVGSHRPYDDSVVSIGGFSFPAEREVSVFRKTFEMTTRMDEVHSKVDHLAATGVALIISSPHDAAEYAVNVVFFMEDTCTNLSGKSFSAATS